MKNWEDLKEWLSSAQPLQDAYVSGDLKLYLPEVYNLFGVPQPEEHHPEIDSGVHTAMVLAHAKNMSNDENIWFAALCHDLGKALTPQNEWPKHHRHEEMGLQPLANLSSRFDIPEQTIKLAEISCTEHLKAHKAMEIRPGNLIQWFEEHGWYNNEEQLDKFLIVCESDACGRKGFEDRLYIQRFLIKEVYNIAKPFMLPVCDVSLLKTSEREIALGAAVSEVKKVFVKYADRQTKIDYLMAKYDLVPAMVDTGVACNG